MAQCYQKIKGSLVWFFRVFFVFFVRFLVLMEDIVRVIFMPLRLSRLR